jgi:hypothetical protein
MSKRKTRPKKKLSDLATETKADDRLDKVTGGLYNPKEIEVGKLRSPRGTDSMFPAE